MTDRSTLTLDAVRRMLAQLPRPHARPTMRRSRWVERGSIYRVETPLGVIVLAHPDDLMELEASNIRPVFLEGEDFGQYVADVIETWHQRLEEQRPHDINRMVK